MSFGEPRASQSEKQAATDFKEEVVSPFGNDGLDINTEVKTNRYVTNLKEKMLRHGIQSKGKSLHGHFSPREAIDVLDTASSRQCSVSEVITSAVEIGLPIFIRRFLAASGTGTRQIHTVTAITPSLATRMTELNIPSKGKPCPATFRRQRQSR